MSTFGIDPLPEGSRLFHIGPPKTGTTGLQSVAAQLRPELLAHGVRYPGRTRNHRLAVAAFLGRPTGWTEADGRQPGAPAMRHWYELLGELEADRQRRSWFGHEYAAQAEPETVSRFSNQLGPSLQVVITLRSFARMLPSMWQEHLKAGGSRGSFEPYLRSMLRRRRPRDLARRARHDHAALVARWAAVVGPERVSVVILDSNNHQFVYRAFEGMLGLPPGLLASSPSAAVANRSLSVPEAELLRRLNQATRANGMSWNKQERWVVQGAVARMLAFPVAAEPLHLPDWARKLANAESIRNAEEIDAMGVRVIGDLANLAQPASVPDEVTDHRTVDAVPLEVTVNVALGLIAAASGQGPDFQRTPERVGRQIVQHAADDLLAVREVGLARLLGAAVDRGRLAALGALHSARGRIASGKG